MQPSLRRPAPPKKVGLHDNDSSVPHRLPLDRGGDALERERQLLDAHWCVPRYGEGGDDLIRSIFMPFGLDVPKRVVHCPSFAATLGLVSQTDALGVFARPLAEVERQSRGIVALNLAEPMPALTVAIVMRRHALLTPAALHFIECLKGASATVSAADDA